MYDRKIQECEGCGRVRDTEANLCVDCLLVLKCCDSYLEAANNLCGCGGHAAEALQRLRERN